MFSFRKIKHALDGFFPLVEAKKAFFFDKRGRSFGKLSCGKSSVHSVVIPCWEWVELMVVALEAAHGRAQESLPD